MQRSGKSSPPEQELDVAKLRLEGAGKLMKAEHVEGKLSVDDGGKLMLDVELVDGNPRPNVVTFRLDEEAKDEPG